MSCSRLNTVTLGTISLSIPSLKAHKITQHAESFDGPVCEVSWLSIKLHSIIYSLDNDIRPS